MNRDDYIAAHETIEDCHDELRRWYACGDHLKARAAAADAEIARLRAALTTIASGIWTAGNSLDTIVWIARRALDKDDAFEHSAALDGGKE